MNTSYLKTLGLALILLNVTGLSLANAVMTTYTFDLRNYCDTALLHKAASAQPLGGNPPPHTRVIPGEVTLTKQVNISGPGGTERPDLTTWDYELWQGDQKVCSYNLQRNAGVFSMHIIQSQPGFRCVASAPGERGFKVCCDQQKAACGIK